MGFHAQKEDGFPPFRWNVDKPKKQFLEGDGSYQKRVNLWQQGKDLAYRKWLEAKAKYENARSQQEADEYARKAKADAEKAAAQAKVNESEAKRLEKAGKAAPNLAKQANAESELVKQQTALEKEAAKKASEQAENEVQALIPYALGIVGSGIGFMFGGVPGAAIGGGIGVVVAEKVREYV